MLTLEKTSLLRKGHARRVKDHFPRINTVLTNYLHVFKNGTLAKSLIAILLLVIPGSYYGAISAPSVTLEDSAKSHSDFPSTSKNIMIRGMPDSVNISINDTVFLKPNIQASSPIRSHKLDFLGNGEWVSFSETKNVFHVYREEGRYKCIFSVSDSMYNSASDTMDVIVTNLPPVIVMPRDTVIRSYDSLVFDFNVKDDGNSIQIRWDFEGDGIWDWKSAEVLFPKHRYAGAVTEDTTLSFTPVLEVEDNDGNIYRNSFKVTVEFKIPRADAGRSTIVCLGDTVVYNGWRSYAPVGEIDKWEWDFDGDGNVDTVCRFGEITRIAPPKPGHYHANLWVVDEFGNRSHPDSVTVIVIKDHPVALIGTEIMVSIFDTVWFHGEGIKRCGNIREYRWDFNGDNRWDWKSKETVRQPIIFKKPGVYYSKFQAIGDDGLKGGAIRIVRVKRDPPRVRVDNDTSVAVGHTVIFTGNAWDNFGTIVKLGWSFKGKKKLDVSSKKPKTWKHVYRKPGVYTAIFQAVDDDKQITKAVRRITVTNESPRIISLRSDSVVPEEGKVLFWVNAQDDGEIVEYAWDFDGDGVLDWKNKENGSVVHEFVTTNGGEPIQIYAAYVFVKDDHQNITVDTVYITIDPNLADYGNIER